MKKLTIITAISLIVSLFMSCDKDKYHRDRYIGDWDFVTHRSISQDNSGSNMLIRYDTICYTGKISIGNFESMYGTHENSLLIMYTENDEIKAWVGKNNNKNISSISTLSESSSFPHGYFHGNNHVGISYFYFQRVSSEMEVRIWDDIYGTKKKGGK